jgi:hypothetical protein
MATRRELLKGGATTGLLALLPSMSFVASAVAARAGLRDPGEILSRSTFRDLLFDDFRVEGAGVDLRLVEIRDLGAGKLARSRDSLARSRDSEVAFSLRFVAPPSTSIGQGTYVLVHPRLGRFPLFVVPMGGDDLPAFEAIINRQVPGTPVVPRGQRAKPRI